MLINRSDSTPTPAENTNTDVTTGTPVATTTTPTTPSTQAAVKEFTVQGSSFSFAPSTMRVNKGDLVRVTFKNQGGTHDWVIDEFNTRTNVLKSGESQTVEFVADKTGSFEYYCSVGTHRQMGMKGTLTVE